jgi:hypothetical protein
VLLSEPGAVGLALVVVHVHRPVPAHVDRVEQGTQLVPMDTREGEGAKTSGIVTGRNCLGSRDACRCCTR